MLCLNWLPAAAQRASRIMNFYDRQVNALPRRYGKKESSLTPAIILINVIIVGVLLLMVFLIYKYITAEDYAPPSRTTPAPPVPQTVVPEETIAATEETEEVTTIIMTKAVTTPPETLSEQIISAPVLPPGDYDLAFFANDLFIGDSIMTGLSGYGFLPAENVFAKIGLSLYTISNTEIEGRTVYKKAKEMNPPRIYIMLGSNEIGGSSGTEMISRMAPFVNELKSSAADSEIIIMTIPPVTADHERSHAENMPSINEYNTLLKSFALENGYTLIDICEALKDSTGYMAEIYAEQDGMHFLGAAYKAMLSNIQKTIDNE